MDAFIWWISSIKRDIMANKTRVWRVSANAKAGMQISEDTAIMAANTKNFIAVGQTGTAIAGPVNFMTTSENIRSGGLFIQMNDFIKMIPGTIVTPIPQEIPFPPVAMFAYVAKVLPSLLALIT
jgi:hypothetical protein